MFENVRFEGFLDGIGEFHAPMGEEFDAMS